jgi:DNA polymerase
VGAAGSLLTELLAGIGLQRADVFVTNIVKCRPPGNRDPEPEEIAACRPYLQRQIELVDPAVVVTLGRFALEHFVPGARISQVHGRPRRLDGRIFVPILHPAAALHRASWRPMLEQDFAALGKALQAEEAARAATQPAPEPGTAIGAPPRAAQPAQLSFFEHGGGP